MFETEQKLRWPRTRRLGLRWPTIGRWFTGALLLLALVVVAGCGGNGKKGPTVIKADLPRLENALPSDSYLAVIGNLSAQSGGAFRELEKRLAPESSLLDALADRLLEARANIIRPLLGANPLVAIAISAAGEPVAGDVEGDLITLALANRGGEAAYQALATDLKTTYGYTERALGNHQGVLYQAADPAQSKTESFLGRVGEVVVFASDEAGAQTALDRVTSGTGGVSDAPGYQQLRTDLSGDNSILYFYYQPAATAKLLARGLAATRRGGLIIPDTSLPTDQLSAYAALGLSLAADAGGFSLRGAALGSEEELAKQGFSLNSLANFSPKLISKLPLTKQFLAGEGFNLAASLDQAWKQMQAQGTALGLEVMTSQLIALRTQVKAMADLDIWDDVIAWMDKGSLLTMNNSGPLPGFTFLAEAGHAPEKATKFVSTLSLFSSLAKSQLPGLSVTKRKLAGGDFTQLRLDTKALGVASSMGVDDINLVFGISEDKNFILSTYPAQLENYGQSHPDWETLLARMPKEVNSLTYFDPALLANYLEILGQYDVFQISSDADQLLAILSKFGSGILASQSTDNKSEFYGYLLVP